MLFNEADVDIKDAGDKGLGVFAASALVAGAYISRYHGKLCTRQESRQLYQEQGSGGEYRLGIDEVYEVDAQNSTHFSRYFNHAEDANMMCMLDPASQRADFFATRDIAAGEELVFDYGADYWRNRPQPLDDTRQYS
jgi:SET domain-containing protein